MTRTRLRTAAMFGGILLLAASSIAEAQWVMVARRAIGRVEQMSQQSPQSGGANYDSAAVMLDVPAPKVYAAVVRRLQNAQGMTITREDPTAMLVQFTNGQQIAGIKLSALSDDLTVARLFEVADLANCVVGYILAHPDPKDCVVALAKCRPEHLVSQRNATWRHHFKP